MSDRLDTHHLTPDLADKQRRLLEVLQSYESVAVALSAGVDSSVVARAAVLALGENAVAVTAVSPALAAGDLEQARELAASIGIRHQVIQTDEFSVPGYQANAGDRCWYCKSELYDVMASRLAHLGVRTICNGTNLDDLGDHRPGLEAARQHGVKSPLVEVGCTKDEVRALARAWNLPVWDRPASPCLSSRIAYGVEVTAERVSRVDQAERFLREALDARELRVRHEQNDLARIEVPLDQLSRLASPEMRDRVVERLRELGFKYIALDLEGFRSGSMNRALPLVELQSLHSAGETEER